MTDNTVFRTQVQQSPASEPVLKSSNETSTTTSAELPYLDYRQQHSKPYVADHFKLGDTWEDPVGGFPKEISTIEEYFKGKIEYGELANSIEAIKGELKKMEKLNNVEHDPRSVVKIETIAAYIEFLNKTAKLKRNLNHYGRS